MHTIVFNLKLHTLFSNSVSISQLLLQNKTRNLPQFKLAITQLVISTYLVELKQISESVGYPFEIYYLDSDPEPFRIVPNYFKQF